MKRIRIAILGTAGVPGCYGGFETLANNLVDYHGALDLDADVVVYCSSKADLSNPKTYGSAGLRYVNLDANGPQSILYDILSLFDSVRRGDTHLLMLGISGALALPVIRLVSRVRIVTNIDGIEWRREKWSLLAKAFLRASEWAAVRFSHTVIADNEAIADYVTRSYRRSCEVISYGGDHALAALPDPTTPASLPSNYALALCRIEPENNVAMILEAFAGLESPLVFVGNWDKSYYGRELKARYKDHPTITIHDPVYEPRRLRAIRNGATVYVHGHSAGGTNPSLVEMMHFGIPVLAHGCVFNRYTTEDRALYFNNAQELAALSQSIKTDKMTEIGSAMLEIANSRYTWNRVGKMYYDIIINQ